MKSVQGDSGHAQVKIVADVYSHIIDDDRRLNAQRFEEQFYQTKETPQAEEVQQKTGIADRPRNASKAACQSRDGNALKVVGEKFMSL